MPTCLVCSGTDFVCDSGFYFCVECQTQSQDVRVLLDEGDAVDENEDFISTQDCLSGASQSSKPCQEEEESLTLWEAFNFCLLGLVNELIELGAKPELKLAVLQLWSKYLGRMEVAFFSDDMSMPKLGPNFRKVDAKLIYGQYHDTTHLKKKKKAKNVVKESLLLSANAELDISVKKKIVRSAKKAVMNQTYEKALLEMASTSQTLTNMTLEMLQLEQPGTEQPSISPQAPLGKISNPYHPGLLLRNRLVVFLYLGLVVCEDNIKLSDLLRWISDGHLSYHNLSKFFPEGSNLGNHNHPLFLFFQPTPPYACVLKNTFYLAKYLQLQSYKVLSPSSLIDHYIKQLNLPDQVGEVAKGLLGLLPPSPEYIPVWSSTTTSLINIEGRAMAHILVALKLIFGLDDSTEYLASKAARNLNELIKSQGETMELFIWEEWEQYCCFRKLAFSLHHFPSFVDYDIEIGTSSIHNAKPVLSLWNTCPKAPDSTFALRSKIMKHTIKSFLLKIEEKECSSNTCEEVLHSPFLPSSTAPFTSYIEHIVNRYESSAVRADESEWGNIVQNFPYEKLSVDFKTKSIQYLIHPEEFVRWAQSHGLEVGLHSGSACSSVSFTPYERKVPPSNSRELRRRLYRVKVILDQPAVQNPPHNPTTNSVFTPCTREYKNRKPLILPEVLPDQLTKDPFPNVFSKHTKGKKFSELKLKRNLAKRLMAKKLYAEKRAKKTLSHDVATPEEMLKMLFLPHTEYWRSESCYPPNDPQWWESEKKNIPCSFMRLVDECAGLIQMKSSDLYKEVLDLEALHDNIFPSASKLFSDCPTHNCRLKLIKALYNP